MNMKLKEAFPDLSTGFFDMLQDRLKANNFNDQRLEYAINKVIDECIYPKPTIAQIIQHDKTIKTYSYNEVLEIHNKTGNAFKFYRPVKIDNNIRYMELDNIEKYGFEIYKKD